MKTKSLLRPRLTPWVTVVIHDQPKPPGWLDTLDLLIEACSTPAALDRAQILFASDNDQQIARRITELGGAS